ncbi:hypothetical protein [Cerasicoccus maritimus]|uniref:hypothetical protein n=1 Tax=Cerasicoccus maritimus TaxID=490089 RepID=UPI002852C2EF|nr:hypothetical protein [Cerasicoccus maritimus]
MDSSWLFGGQFIQCRGDEITSIPILGGGEFVYALDQIRRQTDGYLSFASGTIGRSLFAGGLLGYSFLFGGFFLRHDEEIYSVIALNQAGSLPPRLTLNLATGQAGG